MIRHHDVLYRDMADPVGFFRDAPETELAAFWPYVFGATGQIDDDTAATYSQLMAESQTLVAEEALRVLGPARDRHAAGIGGGNRRVPHRGSARPIPASSCISSICRR